MALALTHLAGFAGPVVQPSTPDPYVPFANDNGGTALMKRTSNMTGQADGQKGVLSVWLRIDAAPSGSANFRVFNKTDNKLRLLVEQSSGLLRFHMEVKNPAGTMIFDTMTDYAYAVGEWHHVLMYWDFSVASPGRYGIYVNDADARVAGTPTFGETVDYTSSEWSFFGYTAGASTTNVMNGAYTDFYFSIADSWDFSIEAHRRQFISETGKPAGSLVDVGSPIILFQDDVATMGVNSGSGGNFTVVNTWTTADTNPSDNTIPENVAPVLDDDTFNVFENQGNGALVGTMAAFDPGDTVTYEITAGNSLGAFAIDPDTGDITVADTTDLDYETNPVFTLTVVATDSGGLTDSATVTINLVDIVDEGGGGGLRHPFEETAPTAFVYVSPSGSNSNSGTEASPVQTIDEAIDRASAGTAIILLAGTYNENVNIGKGGDTDAPIWLKAQTPATAFIVPTASSTDAIKMNGQENLVIEGLDVTMPATAYGIKVSMNDFTDLVKRVVVIGCNVHGSGEDGIKVSQGDEIFILDNTVVGGTDQGIDLVAVNDSVVDGNEVSDITLGSCGIQVKGGSTNVVVSNNYVHDILDDGIHVGGGSDPSVFRSGFDTYEAHNVQAKNNVIQGVGNRGVWFMGAQNCRLGPDNTFSGIGNATKTVELIASPAPFDCANIEIDSNTFTASGWIDIDAGQDTGLNVHDNSHAQ